MSSGTGRRLAAKRRWARLGRALPELRVGLESPVPADLAVGAGTALFVAGTCFAPGEPVESLVLLVDGEEQPLGAFGMPRLETLRANDPDGYRSGFWGMARIVSRARRRSALRAAARERRGRGGAARHDPGRRAGRAAARRGLRRRSA